MDIVMLELCVVYVLYCTQDYTDYDTMSEWATNKSGIHFPLDIHTSYMWQQVKRSY